jgi:hypothetical protein
MHVNAISLISFDVTTPMSLTLATGIMRRQNDRVTCVAIHYHIPVQILEHGNTDRHDEQVQYSHQIPNT